MINAYQETDYRKIIPLRQARQVSQYQPETGTIGSRGGSSFLTLSRYSLILEPAWEATNTIKDLKIAEQSKKIVESLQDIFTSLQQRKLDITSLHPLRGFVAEDGSFLIEWVFDDFRIGFTIESNPDESGWYLISTKKLGSITAYGSISEIDINTLILWLINFVLVYS
jgi:hypothetical protein